MLVTETVYEALGRRIQAARVQARCTQEELARRIGMTRTTITNIERGQQRIQIHTLYAIAEALSVTPEALLPSPKSQGFDDLNPLIPRNLAPAERDWVARVVLGNEKGEKHSDEPEISQDTEPS